jgi:hypothetical protein
LAHLLLFTGWWFTNQTGRIALSARLRKSNRFLALIQIPAGGRVIFYSSVRDINRFIFFLNGDSTGFIDFAGGV